MAELALTSNAWELVIPEGMYDRLHAHLFPGDGDEHAAIIAAGISETPDGRVRLLARNLDLARDGVDFVPGKRGYKMLRAEYVTRHINACTDERLIYLNIHNHGGENAVEFSGDDLRSHERGYPALLDIADGLPVGALVAARRALAGDIWLPDGRRVPLRRTTVIGRRRRVLLPQPEQRRLLVDPSYDRQTRLFGDAGQDILRGTKVAIIGLGGVGSLLAEFLARLGVGHFVLIDADRIEPSNLPRVTGATRLDALVWLTSTFWPGWIREAAGRLSTRKIKIAQRVIRRANPSATVELLPFDMLEPQAARQLLNCDYMFLAADSMRARLLFNAIVHQYLIPGVQLGAKATPDPATGEVEIVHSVARPVTPDYGCLWCNGLINPSKLQEEGQTEDELRAQRYVDDPDVAAPSVITLNAMSAAQAANDFMFYLTGLTRGDASTDYVRFMPLDRSIFFDEPRKSADCTESGTVGAGRQARGDLGPRLPVFHRHL